MRLGNARHGLSADWTAFIRLNSDWNLTTDVEYMVYGAYGTPTSAAQWSAAYTSSFSAKAGLSYQF